MTPVEEGKEKAVWIPQHPTREILELVQAPAEPPTIQSVPVQSNPKVEGAGAITEALVPGNAPLAIEDPKPAGPQDSTVTNPVPQPLSLPPVGFSSSPKPATALAGNPPTSAGGEDPETAVRSFVEHNQKVAETQLKNLGDEQAKLRARLQKVEAGIKRWEALVEALKMSTNVNSEITQSRVGPTPAPDTPDVLDAIPKAKFQPIPR
jgi:hypothetical protein